MSLFNIVAHARYVRKLTCVGCKRTLTFDPKHKDANFHYCAVCKTETQWLAAQVELKEAA